MQSAQLNVMERVKKGSVYESSEAALKALSGFGLKLHHVRRLWLLRHYIYTGIHNRPKCLLSIICREC